VIAVVKVIVVMKRDRCETALLLRTEGTERVHMVAVGVQSKKDRM
jgi:hypothetical protein